MTRNIQDIYFTELSPSQSPICLNINSENSRKWKLKSWLGTRHMGTGWESDTNVWKVTDWRCYKVSHHHIHFSRMWTKWKINILVTIIFILVLFFTVADIKNTWNQILDIMEKQKVKKRFKCNICVSTSYTSNQSLQNHYNSKHLETKFLCLDCGKQFVSKPTLIRHKNSVHEKIKYKCDHCDKEYTCTSSRTMHIKSFHKQDKVRYQCSLCDYQATQKSSLNRHKRSVHEGVKHHCEICGNDFTEKSYLKSHIELRHKGKTLSCKICEREYRNRSSLFIHIKSVHEGRQPQHQCNICESSFGAKSSLTKHVKTIHTWYQTQAGSLTQMFGKWLIGDVTRSPITKLTSVQ